MKTHDALIIARHYDAAPAFQYNAVAAWRELAESSLILASELRRHFAITETTADNPYSDADKMFSDLRQGRFQVSNANCEHPIWTTDENIAFRIVHDIRGHFATGGDFGWRGELTACHAHRQLLSPNAINALYTECIGQTAFGTVNGFFTTQKTAFMN